MDEKIHQLLKQLRLRGMASALDQELERAEKQGVKRPPDQTPLEYQDSLLDNWPEAADEIGELTTMFLQARYSRQPITEQATNQTETTFKRLRSVLRRGLKRNIQTGKK